MAMIVVHIPLAQAFHNHFTATLQFLIATPGLPNMYVGYPESKFQRAIKKKTRIYYKPCILPFDVHTVHYFST